MRRPCSRACAISVSIARPASPVWRARRLSALRAASEAQVTTNTPPPRTASGWRSLARSNRDSSGACAAITRRDCSTRPVNGANQNHSTGSFADTRRIASTAIRVLPAPVGACSTRAASLRRASCRRAGSACDRRSYNSRTLSRRATMPVHTVSWKSLRVAAMSASEPFAQVLRDGAPVVRGVHTTIAFGSPAVDRRRSRTPRAQPRLHARAAGGIGVGQVGDGMAIALVHRKSTARPWRERPAMQQLQCAPDLGVVELLAHAMLWHAPGAQRGEAAAQALHHLAPGIGVASQHPAHALGADVAAEVLAWLVFGGFGTADQDELAVAAVFSVEFRDSMGGGA